MNIRISQVVPTPKGTSQPRERLGLFEDAARCMRETMSYAETLGKVLNLTVNTQYDRISFYIDVSRIGEDVA